MHFFNFTPHRFSQGRDGSHTIASARVCVCVYVLREDERLDCVVFLVVGFVLVRIGIDFHDKRFI